MIHEASSNSHSYGKSQFFMAISMDFYGNVQWPIPHDHPKTCGKPQVHWWPWSSWLCWCIPIRHSTRVPWRSVELLQTHSLLGTEKNLATAQWFLYDIDIPSGYWTWPWYRWPIYRFYRWFTYLKWWFPIVTLVYQRVHGFLLGKFWQWDFGAPFFRQTYLKDWYTDFEGIG